MSFPQEMWIFGVEATDIFLLRNHKETAMKPIITVGTTGRECENADGPISHSSLAKSGLMSVRCITHFNSYVPVI
jgi:hypothetical protein